MASTELALHTTEDHDQDHEGQSTAKPTGSAHKRTYQACLPCRRRKVRCDLGSVDEPGDPPCQRCRREKKDCVFSETRRKRKASDGLGELEDDYVQRNKRIGTSGPSGFDDSMVSNGGVDPNGPYAAAAGASNEFNDSLGLDGGKKKGGNLPVKNDAAAALFSRTITMPSDALHMLVDAASRTEVEDQIRKESESHPTSRTQEKLAPIMIDPAIVAMQIESEPTPDPILSKALHTWASVRFVRAGWFTPQEGIAYVQYFYENLAPLTPVIPPDFSDPGTHALLLNEEPMLTVTILTIASRYMELKGPGTRARSFWIHDKMWTYLQSMVTRMFWGQEQFGGGFCKAGRFRTVDEMEATKRGLRSLGTVESLLLLSDWLPRSMHFPPGDDGDDIIVATPSNPFDSPELFNPAPKHAHTDWTEPAIRSDRMCWSLVGTAYTLAFELGVFDSLIEDGKWTMGRQLKTFYDSERADRIGRLLFVYVSQTCGRLGFPNMMPHQGTEHDSDFLKMDVPAGTYIGPYASVTVADRIQRAWAELTALMRQSNTELFESKQRTFDSIKSGEYMKFLEKYVPKLRTWKERFEQTDVPEKARIMLMMEYEYSRTYINSLSLQAVLDNALEAGSGDQPMDQTSGNTPPAFISSTTVDLKERNKAYIAELIDASRNLLTLAVEDLRRIGALRNAPVRTHFRILSGAMFLLKTFALGDTQSEVLKSLRLLDQTIKDLRESVPDDVHLSLRISELLASLTAALRTKFVRLRVNPPKGTKRSGTNTSKNTTTSHQAASTSNSGRPNSSAANAPMSNNRPYTYTALGIQPREVDLNDLNTTIMPPPNYALHNGAFDDSYTMGDSPTHQPGPYSPHNGHNTTSPPGARPRHNSTSGPPNTNNNNTFSPPSAFSPLSTGSSNPQPYDWLTIDMQPLLQSMHQSAAGPMQSTPNSQSGSIPHPQAIAPSSNHHIMGSHTQGGSPNGPNGSGGMGIGPSGYDFVGGNNNNNNGAGAAWTNGAFGPEISEGLEWLGALGTGTGGFGGWEGEGGYP